MIIKTGSWTSSEKMELNRKQAVTDDSVTIPIGPVR